MAHRLINQFHSGIIVKLASYILNTLKLIDSYLEIYVALLLEDRCFS